MLSIIIPVYNEKSSILEVINQVRNLPIEKEIIVVNDGSTDGTRDLLEEYSANTNFKLLHLKINSGKGSAIKEGIRYINGDYAVIQDADLEYDPNDLITMYNTAKANNWEVVYGNRFHKKKFYSGMHPLNTLGNLLILPLISSILLRQYIPDEATCYKMFKSELLKSIPLECTRFDFCPEITAKLRRNRNRIYFIPIKYTPRTTNQGKKLNPVKDGLESIIKIIKYSLFY